MDSPQQPRPYRSHRVPACDKCRQRKIRCKIEVPGRSCELCAERGFDCLFSATPTAASRQSTANHGTISSERPRKRPRLEAVSSPPISGPRRSHAGPPKSSSRRPAAESAQSTPLTEITGSALRHGSHGASNNVGESSIVVGPMVAEDVQILQQYLTAEPRADPQSREPYSVISNAPESPMIYLSVPRRREGSRLIKDPGHDQREILEQIIGPKKQDVIKLYFKHIHPAFPVLDEEPFTEADGSSISSALLCEVCAISLTFWYQSNTLRHHHCPSEQYFWNLAIAALQEDFLAPNLLTLYPSIVDLLGRPVGSVQGNVVNAGRTMALAHTLGLNRDPSAWRIPDRDKRRRKRLFWGCMVLDQWSSFAHGVPPSILRKQYDVPLPSISVLLTPDNDSDERVKAAVCFIQLCRLSQLLGDVLPSVYDLGEPHKDMARELRRLECDLDEWEASLPEYLQVEAIENGTSVSGASSLRFGYLSVRMLLCRVSLRVASRDNAPDSNDIRQYHVTILRRTATRIADFIISLQSCHLKEFWLSFTGHLIASAATILLRCAVDTADATVAEGCKDSLKSLQTRLHQAKNQDNWDLADMFIRRCDEPISRITAMSHSETRERTTAAQNIEERQRHTVSEGPADVSLSTYSEFTLPIDPLEYPWESLWDMLEGP